MRIPDEFVIAGIRYKVEQKENLVDDYKAVRGLIYFNDSKIELLKSLEHQTKAKVFWHEVLHGIIHNFNVPIEEEQEETIIDALANGLYQVIEENLHLLIE